MRAHRPPRNAAARHPPRRPRATLGTGAIPPIRVPVSRKAKTRQPSNWTTTRRASGWRTRPGGR